MDMASVTIDVKEGPRRACGLSMVPPHMASRKSVLIPMPVTAERISMQTGYLRFLA